VTQRIVLNENDQQRAQIIRRYRLYTYQPDEMITMLALASMNPARRDFDPKLYQYGGLWVYPVGALLKLGMIVHFVPIPPPGEASSVYYLDHPEAFGRFYVVARFYVVMWGVLGGACVFWLV